VSFPESPLTRARQEFFARAPVAMAIASDEGELLDANDALSHLFGVAAPELLGRSLPELAHPEDRDAVADVLARDLVSEERVSWMGRFRAREAGGWHMVRWALAGDATNELLLLTAEDRTSIDYTTRQLIRQAQSDPLTGLGNRRLLERALRRTVSSEPQTPAFVIVLDLDGLKAINDAHGHQTGDAVLRSVAARLRERTRPHDVVVRTGGDEFAVVTPAAEMNRHDAARAAQVIGGQVVQALAEPHANHGAPIAVTASVGVAAWPWSGDTPDKLLAAADVAMYRSKRNAPGQIALCTTLTDV
jgi:diguanylate cyclase (GGDEF)-like protein/PAS domain S-box-containing protein